MSDPNPSAAPRGSSPPPHAAPSRQPPPDPGPAPQQSPPEPPPDARAAEAGSSAPVPRRGRRRARRLAREPDSARPPLTGAQRLLILDAWRRSGLPAGDFAPLVGISKHTLYSWKKRFDAQGPAGLDDQPRGAPAGSRLPEVTRRAILMMKEANPDWGVERISALLLRGPALPASPQAVARVLHEAGYETEEAPTRPHPERCRVRWSA